MLDAPHPDKHVDLCPCPHDHRDYLLARCTPEDGCWTWALFIDYDGYGNLTHRGFVWRAHRFAYEAFIGRIPDGLVIDHLCRNRACVNPEHLEAVTAYENNRRGHVHRGLTVHPPRTTPVRQYLSRAQVDEDDPRHGTRSGYNNLKCRCQRCRDASSAYQRKKRV